MSHSETQVFPKTDDKSCMTKGGFMKLITTLRNRLRKNLLKNQSGQGATEYILLLVVIVGLVMAFGPRIKKAMSDKLTDLDEGMAEIQTK